MRDEPVRIELDVVIFGGGAAGLWLLDGLRRRGARVLLLEAEALGRGQTVASQGIIHGGLKYTLHGALSGSARAIRDMPALWRRCAAGRCEPDLSAMPVHSDCCYLWRTQSLTSKAAMIGARAGLRIRPVAVRPDQRPQALRRCPGTVYRLDEQVIDPVGFLRVMRDRNAAHLLRIDAADGLAFETGPSGAVEAVHLSSGAGGERLRLQTEWVVLAAGAGNAELRRRMGLRSRSMQRRPLHMTLVRGELPMLWGHCVDGSTTRVTISSATDAAGRTVWQVGGEAAERGVEMDSDPLIRFVRAELEAVLPALDTDGLEWATYRIDRAEGRTADGSRPEDVQIIREGNVVTGWPTKLALAPHMAQRVIDAIGDPPGGGAGPRPSSPPPRGSGGADVLDALSEVNWPRPATARPPWEMPQRWTSDA